MARPRPLSICRRAAWKCCARNSGAGPRPAAGLPGRHLGYANKRRSCMQLGMIGLGRMGANMVRRLMRGGHQCVVWDQNHANVEKLEGEGATGAAALDDFLKALQPPRAVWLMVPSAAVEGTLAELSARMEKGDIVIDGGNSYYIDEIRRAKELIAKGRSEERRVGKE